MGKCWSCFSGYFPPPFHCHFSCHPLKIVYKSLLPLSFPAFFVVIVVVFNRRDISSRVYWGLSGGARGGLRGLPRLSGGRGPESGRAANSGKPRRNAMDSQGFSQKSVTTRGVGLGGGVTLRTKVVVVEGAFLNFCCWWTKSLLLLSGIGAAVALNQSLLSWGSATSIATASVCRCCASWSPLLQEKKRTNKLTKYWWKMK